MTDTNQQTTTEAPKRNVKTRLFVHYIDQDGTTGITTGFDSKLELDQWLNSTTVRPVRIIRGVEKKFQNRVVLS